MAFLFSPSLQSNFFKSTAISLTILTTLLFYLLYIPSPPTQLLNPPENPFKIPSFPHRSLHTSPTIPSCSISNLTSTNGLFNYFSFHFCLFQENHFLSIPFLALSVLLQFYILVKTAQDRFSVVVTKLCTHLKLSPSMGAVTLLALGNGAPDVFASVAAVRGGQARTGFGAILSAGTFVSAFVVGFVAIYAAPFAVDPGPFVRDVLFYLIAALFLFYVYLSAEIFLWQALGFVGFYLFFVGIVFWMDVGTSSGKGKRRGIGGGGDGSEVELIGNEEEQKGLIEMDYESGEVLMKSEDSKKQIYGFWRVLGKISQVWELPVSVLLKLTIPQTSPSEWSRFYQSANIALCPLALLYSCRSFMPLDHPVLFLFSNVHFALWLIVLCGSCSLAILHFIVEKEPPKTEQIPVVLVAFVMSVFWISTVAGELLNCLAALGALLKLPPAILGLTVLAWGNSVGDLVADVALAKAGQPAMAMAGCFACPMFNMLFGLGTALVMQAANVYPDAYALHFHVSIVMAFIFLLLSLMGSILVVTWHRFRVPRFWGFCLVGLYVIFMILSLIIAMFWV
ncbi:cation/calcium exchanger 5 isoform X1 [Coffea arabica]|uniref:Cation/calcium exchanger 5 isoform X1 n=1 Tax=Coffea arabica TaxID=13443 RepID=A0A6P6VWY8_COFAR|nr:cation/calcium exchanger 5-like isoform X1 [Coffea arabica]